jgi:hypothetical protein
MRDRQRLGSSPIDESEHEATFGPWLTTRSRDVVPFALAHAEASLDPLRRELGPALRADPVGAFGTVRDDLPCTVGREYSDPIGLLAATSYEDPGAALREVLAWPDVFLQADAALLLGEDGDTGSLSALHAVAETHWSAPVRARARWAMAEITGEPGGDKPTDDLRDHGVGACTPQSGERWRVRFAGDRRTITPRPRRAVRVVPLRAPKLEVPTEAGPVQLPHGASGIARIGAHWIYGVDRGEFGGGLVAVGPDGVPVRLREGPVRELVTTRRGLVANVGLFRPSLVLVEPTGGGGVRARHLLTLPAPVQGGLIEDDDATLIIPTSLGVLAVGPQGAVSLLPCAW